MPSARRQSLVLDVAPGIAGDLFFSQNEIDGDKISEHQRARSIGPRFVASRFKYQDQPTKGGEPCAQVEHDQCFLV